VFYLDLCRRDPARRARFAQLPSVVPALEKILAGRDPHYQDDRFFLGTQLARGGQARPAPVRPFWRRLFREVYPPQEYREVLSGLEARPEGRQWQIRCDDPYQADYVLHCLHARPAQLFWRIAASHLEVEAVRLVWSEGGRPHERVIRLAADAA
jgi:hypothetical protein